MDVEIWKVRVKNTFELAIGDFHSGSLGVDSLDRLYECGTYYCTLQNSIEDVHLFDRIYDYAVGGVDRDIAIDPNARETYILNFCLSYLFSFVEIEQLTEFEAEAVIDALLADSSWNILAKI